MMSQKQQYYSQAKKNAEINKHFNGLVRNKDISKAELQALIIKRPEIWSRFSHWLDILD